MTERTPGRALAGLLSLLLPGAGQVYAGARRRGLVLVAVTVGLGAAASLLLVTRPLGLAASAGGRRVIAALLLADVALLAFRLFAIVDAWRRPGRPSRPASLALFALATVAALPHVAAGYVAVRGYGVLESVFADEEPRDVLPARGLFLVPPVPVSSPRPRPAVRPAPPAARRRPALPSQPLESSRRILAGAEQSFERPWVTILLLGSDAGPGQWGERTDTMILAALQRGTGRTVAFGIPRNLVDVPLPRLAGRPGRRFREPLNALYAWAHTRT
ncbi:MAG: hypothetical protein H0V40_09585, partial [Actinobacteria bacterium]|nr:hypothetical protein [Actinomycetota bacterium]